MFRSAYLEDSAEQGGITQSSYGVSIPRDFNDVDGHSQDWPEPLLIRAQVVISNPHFYIQQIIHI